MYNDSSTRMAANICSVYDIKPTGDVEMDREQQQRYVLFLVSRSTF